ncbi:MAG: urea transporter [Pseudomonadota bacterium]|nr:urea transporter [Pseudomonadota bacterium]
MSPLFSAWRFGLAWLDAHAAVVFAQSRAVAALCLAATAIYPRVLLAGLAAWLLAEAVLAALALPAAARPAARTNALLTGLALAALWAPTGTGSGTWWLIFPLAVLLVLGLSLWLSEWLWQAGMLPALSLPFSLAVLSVLPVLGGLSPAIPALPIPPLFAPDTPVGALLATFGWVFLSPHPVSGALAILALLVASRWLALLGLAGYALGHAVMVQLAADAAGPGYAFNFPLAAMAVGGYYCRPGTGSFVLGLLAAALAALGCAVFANTFGIDGIPVLSLPFVAATLLLLAAVRHARRGITPVLAHPDTPERQAEAQRLATSRLGAPGSLPLAPPFLGEWQVYQGFDGPHTHRGPWRHALDFFLAEAGKSYRNKGAALADYLCFGLPVLAPVAGEVVTARDGLPDNPPGLAETRENWGNHVVIRTLAGQHVWLAHLRQGSVAVAPGAWVRVGERLGACGNSGRSPQPHLHLHVQARPGAGEPTLPFHLDNVEVDGGAAPRWHLAWVPGQGEGVRAAVADAALCRALTLPVGRRLGFEVREVAEQDGNHGGTWRPWQVEVTLTLAGQLRLSGGKASLAVAPGPHAFALYDRQGGRDPWLDLFALALGLTPFAPAKDWRDAPPARLFPASLGVRAALWLTRPLGSALDSRYRRAWQPEAATWQQSGRHLLPVAPGWAPLFETEVDIAPDGRIARIEGRQAGRVMEMRLASLAQIPDEGIPAWEREVACSVHPLPQPVT